MKELSSLLTRVVSVASHVEEGDGGGEERLQEDARMEREAGERERKITRESEREGGRERARSD